LICINSHGLYGLIGAFIGCVVLLPKSFLEFTVRMTCGFVFSFMLPTLAGPLLGGIVAANLGPRALRQRPSSQVVMAARQLLTRKWWETERTNYELVLSQYVIDEASGGDPILAAERMQALAGIPLLPNAPQITQIANEIMTRTILPPKAQVDALHIATVAHHRIQYLLTWNCKHIANAKILPRIHQVLTDAGVPIPVICTPEELLGNDSEIDD
jgi:hypothetical protein